jgi:hypothetical protein
MRCELEDVSNDTFDELLWEEFAGTVSASQIEPSDVIASVPVELTLRTRDIPPR